MRWIKALGIALAVFAAICLAGLLLLRNLDGIPSDYAAQDHDEKLAPIAARARPLIAELNRHRAEHGQFPPGIKSLGEPDNPWIYMALPSVSGYSLSKDVGWDALLTYLFKNGSGQWIFDPGDGSPRKEIVL